MKNNLCIFFICACSLFPADYDFTFSVLKYKGGGDWYEGLTGVKELMHFMNSHTSVRCRIEPVVSEAGSEDIFQYPFLYMTGHGTVKFNPAERKNIRSYLQNGGFLFANDDYGMDKSFREEIKKIFPLLSLTQIPASHDIFNAFYSFSEGLPKIHKHDGGSPEAYGLFYNSRLIIFYTFNTDIGDGWAPYNVHKDPEDIRIKALKMGVNIIIYSMIN